MSTAIQFTLQPLHGNDLAECGRAAISWTLPGPLNSPTPVRFPRTLFRPDDQARAKQFSQRLPRTVLAVGKKALLVKPAGRFHRVDLRPGLGKQPRLQVLVDSFDVTNTTPRHWPFASPIQLPRARAPGCAGTLPRGAPSEVLLRRLRAIAPATIDANRLPHVPIFHAVDAAHRGDKSTSVHG